MYAPIEGVADTLLLVVMIQTIATSMMTNEEL
jgi:hypothetical protein